MKKPEHYDDTPPPGLTLFAEPRDFHFGASNAVLEARAAGQQRALLRVSVGIGRAMLVAADMANYYNTALAEDPGNPARMLHVTSRAILHEQAKLQIPDLLPELLVEAGMEQPPQAGLTFSTFSALKRQLNNVDPRSFDYIVWDSITPFNAATDMQVVRHFEPSFALAIEAGPPTNNPALDEYFGDSVYTFNPFGNAF